MQALAQIAIFGLPHSAAGGGLFFFNSGLCGKPALDVLFHTPPPSFGIGKETVGFEDFQLLGITAARICEHLVNGNAQAIKRFLKPLRFNLGIIGNGIGHNDPRFMQIDQTFGHAILCAFGLKHHRFLVTGRERIAIADKGAQFGHLRQNHRHNFKRVNFICGKFACLFGLYDQDPKRVAEALDWNAEKR